MDLHVDNIDELLQARSQIDEELSRRKSQVTVFFTDVVGSTTYFDRFGDTAGLLLLHRHDNLVTHAVEEFRGSVVKTIGDSVMAEFPEPVSAVRAAIAIQQRLSEQNQRVIENERLRVRIGINCGVGFRKGNDLFGDAVNLAARITKRSGSGQILVSNSVREALADTGISCKSLGKVLLDGKAETEELHEVVWPGNTSPGLDPAITENEQLDKFVQKTPDPSEIAARSHLEADAPVPLQLSRYEILSRLGVGGMGIVLKARDRETGEIVAVKILKTEIADQPKLIDAFKNELRLARKITHKNVCRIYDFNRSDGVSYITMEFVEGESLRFVLNRFNVLSARTGIKIAVQICEGLREAHAQGIVHQDLKPENLMIDGLGNVKLMDFGLARLIAESSTAAIGTPSYMAPEQAQGGPVDQRCDIYALGLVLFEMFTGTAAFTGDTPMVVALKQIQDSPANPRDVERSIPDHVAKVILRCLEKDPEKRFQSVEEVESALLAESVSDEIASTRSHMSWMAFALFAAAAILIVVALVWLNGGSDDPPRAETTPSAAEFAAFRMAESLNTEESWNAFLNDYPRSELVDAALKKLQTQVVKKAVAQQSVANMAKKNVTTASTAAAASRAKFVDTIAIDGGVFMMGNDQGKGDEKPRHQVRLDGFRISASPITNRQYLSFLEDTGHPRPRDPGFARNYLLGSPDVPVVNISYDDAVTFCKWASMKFSIPVRLPTEAEWEYAALHGQTANTAEWVSDYYSRDYYTISPVKNPKGPTTGSRRVIRGPSTKGSGEISFRRSSRDPRDGNDQTSFRVVVDSRVDH